MIDHSTFRIASSTVAIVGPRVAVISGSAHSPRTATIDAPAHTSKKTEDFLRSAVDPLLSIPCSPSPLPLSLLCSSPPWPSRWWRSRSRSCLRVIARCRSLDRFRDTAFCTARSELAAEI
jgi:hypothetical protein